jgi:hypothetical protein
LTGRVNDILLAISLVKYPQEDSKIGRRRRRRREGWGTMRSASEGDRTVVVAPDRLPPPKVQ